MTRYGHIAHPVTGETLDPDNIAQLQQATVDWEAEWTRRERLLWQQAGASRQMYDAIVARLAEIRPAAPLPRPTRQTDKQRATRRCPRCRTWYDEKEDAA